ncbi:MAG: hypothetical protein ABJC09_08740 [Terriglobia bacterium]
MALVSDAASFDQAVARLPRWILALAAAGTALAGAFLDLNHAGGFLVGALAAWINLRLIERAANRLTRHTGAKSGSGAGAWVFMQFTGLLSGALVILIFSGFNMAAAFLGFLVCPAAVVLEIVYELTTLNFKNDHS